MHYKSERVLMVALFFVFSLIVCVGSVAGKWVPDDEGNLHWWEPPKEQIYHNVKDTPTILDQTNAEVLFLMDTSGSMSDEFSTLCTKIDDIVQGLQNRGINLEYKIVGITSERDCTTGTVHNLVANPTVNHCEDWGPAVEDIAKQYPWQSGYARIAVPMSDEGAEDGDSWYSSDDAAIDRAKEAAKDNSVGVIPIVCSGYDQDILDGATELADNCWGSVFVSTAPASDLVDGIVNSINQIFNPVSDKLNAQIFVDDAWASPNVPGSINKIAGDIAFLVVQVQNGADKKYTVDLEITYPNNWYLVSDNPVMKRESLIAEEKALGTDENIGTQPGKVVIKNVEVDKDDPDTDNDEGRSKQYLVKLIIPTDQAVNTSHMVSAKIVFSSAQTSSIFASEDAFQISIKNSGDIILTNRHLLINRHAHTAPEEVETIEDILKEIHTITHQREAVVFYVDWWDEYDEFASDEGSFINPTGTPIKNWDRSNLDYASQTEAELNTVPWEIDNYLHYLADQLGGRDNRRNLLIVGDDTVIPYYRFQNPAAGVGCPGDDCWDASPGEYRQGPTQHYSDAATENYLFTDNVYADTDGEAWGEGGVDHMHVGRVVAENAIEMLRFLKNINSDTAKPPRADNAVISCFDGFADDLKDTKAKDRLSDVGYTVFDSYTENGVTTSFTTAGWNTDDIIKAFRHGQDAWVYRGHGHNRGTYNYVKGSDFQHSVAMLDGKGIIPASELFKSNYAMLFMLGCNMGIADIEGDTGEQNDSLFVYEAVENNINSVVAAQSFTSASFNNPFANQMLKQVTGSRLNWINASPESIGYSLNHAKRKATKNNSIHHVQQFTYLLYGAPWKTLDPPDARQSKSMIYGAEKESFEKKQAGIITQSFHTLTKTISESISNYQMVSGQGFDFVTIEEYEQLKQGLKDTPVVPVKRFEVNVPLDAININITVNRSNPLTLGSYNIPVYNDVPPVFGEPVINYYVAPDVIGLYDKSHYWYKAKELNYMAVMVDMIPVSFDAVTGKVALYQGVEIEVTYDTEQNGVLLHAKSDAQNYNSGDAITVNAFVENIGTQASYFDVNVELQDSMRKTVDSKSASHQVDSGNIAEIPFQFTAPAKGGNYWIETTVFSDTQQIGKSLQQINVNPGAIINFEISRCVPGSTAHFSVTFANQSISQIEATFGLLVYNGPIKKAEFFPKVYNIACGDQQTATFTWDIPIEFPGGDYLAVATVTCDEYTSSLSESFIIGGNSLDKGWNLISLCRQPSDTSIDSVLKNIEGKYSSVWAFQNNSWKVYDPDHPGFSDLSTMDAGWGYWIYMTETGTLTVTGAEPSKSIDFVRGWNLVGYNSCTSQSIEDALESIKGKYISVWAYINGKWRVYDPANLGFSDLDNMEPGYGYWIKTTQNCTWTLP
ncbi:MAG: C25 family cysteine peptidase [Candidatus Marinimicrobia bacterium]|nr:C25 family cysteine peptidase [Candidatus Neomarinimicrobiota bacterium]